MSPYTTLYLKELKAIRLPGAALLAATLAIVLFAASSAADGDVHAGDFLLVLPYLCPPLLAGLAIHAVSTEWSANTQHQLLALPVPHAAVLLTKAAAVLSLGIAVFVLSTSGVHYVHDRVIVSLTPMFPPLNEITPGQIWSIAGSLFGGYTVYLIGLACVAVAVRLRVQRFHSLAIVTVFLLGIWVSSMLQDPVSVALRRMLSPGVPWTEHVEAVYLFSLHRVLVGGLYTALGTWLFARQVEA